MIPYSLLNIMYEEWRMCPPPGSLAYGPGLCAAADVRSDKTGGGNEKSLGAQQRQQSAVDTLTIYTNNIYFNIYMVTSNESKPQNIYEEDVSRSQQPPPSTCQSIKTWTHQTLLRIETNQLRRNVDGQVRWCRVMAGNCWKTPSLGGDHDWPSPAPAQNGLWLATCQSPEIRRNRPQAAGTLHAANSTSQTLFLIFLLVKFRNEMVHYLVFIILIKTFNKTNGIMFDNLLKSFSIFVLESCFAKYNKNILKYTKNILKSPYGASTVSNGDKPNFKWDISFAGSF